MSSSNTIYDLPLLVFDLAILMNLLG